VLYLLFGKVLPGALFAVFVIVQLQILRGDLARTLATEPGLDVIALLLNRVLSLLFAAAVAFIYIVRQPPRQAIHSPLAFVVSMYASFGLLAIPPIGRLLAARPIATDSGIVLTLSNLLVASGIGFSVYALTYLRLNFSILPEARSLVRGGPYRLVRHPVYLGEILSGLGIVLAMPSVIASTVWASFVVAQMIRIGFEEEVLAAQIPEYGDFMRTTRRRVIPLLY
jgi:protein-S-isoprenylcysteine O-methyltransferase Ste14